MRKMRKIFVALIVCVLMCGACSAVEINPDTEIHNVMGGLYALVSAAAMNGDASPDIAVIRRYFADAPSGWNVKFQVAENDLWAGVPVGKYSRARKYLRSVSQKLGIADTPAGPAWLGEDFAWIRAGSIRGGKLTVSPLKAAQSEGAIFLSVDGNTWWQAYPDFTQRASQELVKLWGVKVSGLHKPQGVSDRVSIYDEVRPSEVRKPADMHTRRKHAFGESYDIDMGSVIFNPIPHTHYDTGNN